MAKIGIDLGGTNIAVGIVGDDDRILIKDSVPTALPRSAEAIADDIAALSRRLASQAGLEWGAIGWAGLGTPGTVNSDTGIIEYANNLQFKEVPMRRYLEERMGLRIYLENDANAAAYGEFVAGAAKGSRSAVVITLGTGVGSGIIIDGKILHGFNFAGGEAGHMVIVAGGRPCTCGRRGCWEAYASATGLITSTREAMLADKTSLMWSLTGGDVSAVNGKTAFDAMRGGDETGKKVVDQYIWYLGCGLINIVNLFQPEVLCIGGGICKEGDTLLRPLAELLRQEHYSHYTVRQSRLCVATLGNDAGIIGAALLGSL